MTHASMARFDQDLAELDRFFTEVLEGRAGGEDSVTARARTFYGTAQGPWYTVGWKMASVIETVYGRERLVESFCDESRLLKTYNSAAKKYERKNEVKLARWSKSALDSFDVTD